MMIELHNKKQNKAIAINQGFILCAMGMCQLRTARVIYVDIKINLWMYSLHLAVTVRGRGNGRKCQGWYNDVVTILIRGFQYISHYTKLPATYHCDDGD